ncbi:carbohydrate-binding protein [Dyadobacter arcticus]|uniref:CBM6 domain-containing protein n=1 Tax=Dyadobacter arcticus TaxID=1078754 RepID=A0ABX0UU96_9BACT|nr:carbohydrate-binding protein [Dyadobacter arcticus]NIJ55963.1 hypothetical protein [Dyadobacter arcticus]
MNPKSIRKKISCISHMLALFLLLSQQHARAGLVAEDADIDPVLFTLTTNNPSVTVGEEFELTIACSIRNHWDDRLFSTMLDTDFRLKMVFPDAFVQTGGSYFDFVGDKLSGSKPRVEYKVRGRFTSTPLSSTFQLLRGTAHSVEIGRFLARGQLAITVTDSSSGYVLQAAAKISAFSQCLEAENMAAATGAVTSDPNASNGNTRGLENQYNHYVDYAVLGVPSAGVYQITLRYYSSSPPTINVLVNGGNTQSKVLSNSNSWNITPTETSFNVNLNAGNNIIRIEGTGGGSCRQDRICVTGSAAPCTSPTAPAISKTSGTSVCSATNQTVTLTATGCAGAITWFKDGAQTGTGTSITKSDAGNYTATCTQDGCTSAISAVITVTQSANCGAAFSQCAEAESMAVATGPVSSDPNASNGQTRGAEGQYNHYVDYVITNVPSAGSYQIKLRYYSSSAPIVSLMINGGASQTFTLPNSGSWNIGYTDYTFNTNLTSGNNTIRIAGSGAGSCRQDRICVTGGTTCVTPAAPTIAKTAGTTVCPETNQTVTLSASGCAGTITWFRDGTQVASGATYTTSVVGTYTAKCTVESCISVVSGSLSVTKTVGCTNSNTVTPKISSTGYPEVLTLSIVADPNLAGAWLISDIGTVNLPSGYEWSYFVGNKWIRKSSNLVNEPWQSNSPGRIVKMATKIGLDTLNRWPCPNEGCGGYYRADAVAQLVPGARGGLTTFIFN